MDSLEDMNTSTKISEATGATGVDGDPGGATCGAILGLHFVDSSEELVDAPDSLDFSPQTPEEWYQHNKCHAKSDVHWKAHKEIYSNQICECAW